MPNHSGYRVSCRVSAAILQYAEEHDIDTQAICEQLDTPCERLTDNRAWIDADVVHTLWHWLEKETGDPYVGEPVGRFAVKQGTLGALTTILRLSGSPKRVMQKVDRVVGYFDNFHQFRAIRIGTTSAMLEVKTPAGGQTHHDCAFIRGVLGGIPALWGLPEAKVESMSCAVPLEHLPPREGRVYFADDDGNVFSRPVGDESDVREEGHQEEDGTFTIDGVAYGSTACLYRLSWEKESTRQWWQRTFPNSSTLSDTVAGLENDLREMEEMYEKLHRASSRLEQAVADRTAELEQANQELAELAHKLERQSRLKSEFIADVSHELRTTITAIMGFAELMSSKIYGPLNERQLGACHRISVNTRTLLAMINDLLDLSRLQVGRMEAVNEPLYLREVVEEAVATVSALAEQKDLVLSSKIEQEVPVRLISDKTKIKQMLLNLLINALKYTDRGRVSVRVHMNGPEEVSITVEDTGHGIAEEDLPLLFEEYSRVGRENGSEEGTGLGLYITRKMAELLGGRVEAVSRVDHGSAFTIVLPARTAAESEVEEISEEPSFLDPVRNRMTVLVADGNIEARKSLALALEAEGLRVETCGEGRQLLGRIAQLDPDVLVLDPLLDHEDGWSVLQKLRAEPATEQLPVIVVSASPQNDLCEAWGVSAAFAKPVDRGEVAAQVLSILGLTGEES